MSNRAALITGGASGIGLATAVELARSGTHVFCLDLNDFSDEARPHIEGLPITHVAGDVRSFDDCVKAVDIIESSSAGALDCVFANAGVVHRGSAESQTLDDWSDQIDTILTGTFLTCKASIPALRRSGGGAIVLNGSNCSHIGCPDRFAYTAAKSAMPVLAKQLSNDFFHSAGIRTNCVSPGYVDSGMTRRIWSTQTGRPDGTDIPQDVLSKWQQPQSIASVVAFLCSDAATDITGVTIPVSRTALLRVASPRLA
ncbi:SDR family oxidoreductase [Streptomyces enissocaesilis]|uniref:SDR family NAD(P)-dependent oxidoreductase n=1 Tax=Streptomyces enissocaesilis TaxID=332589 RepID=A0ABP6JNJ6_9ACTN